MANPSEPLQLERITLKVRKCRPGHHRWDLQALGTVPDQGAVATYVCGLCSCTVSRPMYADETHVLAQLAEARLALQAVLARLNDGLV